MFNKEINSIYFIINFIIKNFRDKCFYNNNKQKNSNIILFKYGKINNIIFKLEIKSYFNVTKD